MLAPVPSVVFCQFPFVILGEVVVSSLGVLLFAERQLIGGFPYFIHFEKWAGWDPVLQLHCNTGCSSSNIDDGVLPPVGAPPLLP